MALRLFRTFLFALLTIALLGPSPSQADDQDKLRPTIAFLSTRDHPDLIPFNAAEIYLINPDVDPDDLPCTADPEEAPHCDLRRLTDNLAGDGFAKLSPDGKRIVFDSNRRRDTSTVPPEPLNTSDLFLMKTDGKEQTFLTRGSNASWSPDGKQVAFHASASGTGLPIKVDGGAATTDSDIFVVKVGECLEHHDACQMAGSIKRNLTNTNTTTNTPCDPVEPYAVEDDANWSPDGQQIAFTSHLCTDTGNNSSTTEIYVMNADGTGRTQLTHNDTLLEEERGANWSPDGTRIAFMCRPGGTLDRFQICVMDADGTNRTQLTDDGVFRANPEWSPDGEMISFDKVTGGAGTREIFKMKPVVGADQVQLTKTDGPSLNGYAHWGVDKTTGQDEDQVAADSQDRAADKAQGKADHGTQHKAKQKGKQDTRHKKHQSGGGKRHR